MNRLCLVTNATAKSVCRYVMIYLNEQNLPINRIKEIKTKLNLIEGLDSNKFLLNGILESFIDKNIYFLELFKYLKNENRYLNFLEKLELRNKIQYYFNSLTNINKIYDDFYNRKVFHTSVFCKFIKHDYVEEGVFEKNTGVFADEIITKKTDYYKIDEDYLSKLKLRECKICKNIINNALGSPIETTQIINQIKNSQESISLTFDLLKDEFLYKALKQISRKVKIEVFLNHFEWRNNDINHLLKDKFILRLTHESFSFFNSNSLILLDEILYFYKNLRFFTPDENYVNINAFNILKNNTISLSDDITVNSSYAYNVPVKYLHGSYDDIFGDQTIIELDSYGLTGFLTLKCHFSSVPNSIFGFWEAKLSVFTNGEEQEDNIHNYFGFKCLDPNVMKFL